MIEDIKQNFADFRRLLDRIEATNHEGVPLLLENALLEAVQRILVVSEAGGQLLFIGNGGSAAIAGHMATDFWKNAGVKALAFNDSVLLTCLSNDLGFKHVFEKSIETFAGPRDILLAISSSGKSENILRGVRQALSQDLLVITFSGFKPDNPLRRLGHLNFYVPQEHYGHVECIHHLLCHALLNVILNQNTKTIEKAALHE